MVTTAAAPHTVLTRVVTQLSQSRLYVYIDFLVICFWELWMRTLVTTQLSLNQKTFNAYSGF